MSAAPSDLPDALAAAARRRIPGTRGIRDLRRLSGGANQETWSFDARTDNGVVPLILRRRPGGAAAGSDLLNLSLEKEAGVVTLAGECGVPVPGPI